MSDVRIELKCSSISGGICGDNYDRAERKNMYQQARVKED